MSIRVLSYNIHGGRGIDSKRDYFRIGRLLEEQQIDIALIQEFDTRCFREDSEQPLKDLCGDRFLHVSLAPTITEKPCIYGNAILSKFPILEERTLDISIKGKEPRNILDILVQTPQGPLQIINTHKGLGVLERAHQLRLLYKMLEEHSEVPLIVGGDMNEWQFYSRALKMLNRLLHPVPLRPTFPTWAPVLPLDRMWCRPSEILNAYGVLKTPETRIYSDHFPIFVEVDFNNC